jgi:hypothetical protein
MCPVPAKVSVRSLFPRLLGLALALAFFSPAWAFQPRFGVDPRVDLSRLAASDAIDLKVAAEYYEIQVDASAVLEGVALDALWKASLSFASWSGWGMPGVREMRVVARPAEREQLVWAHMRQSGVSSRHYLRVQWNEALEPSTGARGNTFVLHQPARPYRVGSGPSARVLENDPSFRSFSGSWYLLPLDGGRVYVRYFVEASVLSSFPSWLVSPIVKSAMPDGVREMIGILARQGGDRR